ncbi:unnamed protein product [Candidula unifasciata]|uniref:Peptidase metallopeptidase domain-containing protein n=1 Tax=Candidula unifasciata TaxID=100452 RepID=A0A8S3Z9Z5_9EUPU|nr:unnamed protein product [Candidula unifasciata]
MNDIFKDYTSCQSCNTSGHFSEIVFRRLKSTASSLQVVTKTKKMLSKHTSSSEFLCNDSQGSIRQSASALRCSLVPSSLWYRWLLCWVLMFSVVVRCQGQDVAEHGSTDTETVDKYLSTFGYYSQNPGETQNQAISRSASESEVTSAHSEVERSRAIRRLQSFFHLPVNGQLDVDTKKIMGSARCGRKDIEAGDEPTGGRVVKVLQPGSRRRVKRYTVNRYPDGTLANWNVSQLTWRISRPSRQLSEAQQREIVRTSLAMWAEYMPIKFMEERGQETPDIDIQFARGEHGPKPDPIFDGNPKQSLNILAHAWGPGYNIKGLAGDVHFDEDDDWKDYNTLLGVAVHELGHSMGLGHSEDESAIMYPVYRSVVALAQDDIDGITLMYGSGAGTRPRPRTQAPPVWTYKPDPRYITERPDPRHRTERPDPRKYIAVSDENVHTLTQHGVLEKSELLQDVYPEVPINPDVGFSIYTKRTVYFIKDNRMWAYKEGQLVNEYPKSLSSLRFPEPPKFTVTLNQRDGSYRLYLFGTRYFWMFDVDRLFIVQPQPISSFSGDLPPGVRFAARWLDNHLYAVTKNSYVIMDMETRRITHESPISGKPEWLQALCGRSNRISTHVTSLLAAVMLASVITSYFQR